MFHVIVKAESARSLGNGLWELVLPGRELTEKERDSIESLFPNLSEQAYSLLQKEALLGAIARESDLAAAPKKNNKATSAAPHAH